MTRFTLTAQQLVAEFPFSMSTLRRYINERIFLPGRHFVPIGFGKQKSKRMWDPEEVAKTLEAKAKRMVMK